MQECEIGSSKNINLQDSFVFVVIRIHVGWVLNQVCTHEILSFPPLNSTKGLAKHSIIWLWRKNSSGTTHGLDANRHTCLLFLRIATKIILLLCVTTAASIIMLTLRCKISAWLLADLNRRAWFWCCMYDRAESIHGSNAYGFGWSVMWFVGCDYKIEPDVPGVAKPTSFVYFTSKDPLVVYQHNRRFVSDWWSLDFYCVMLFVRISCCM